MHFPLLRLAIFLMSWVVTSPLFAETPLEVSGRYPHLAMFNHQGECGTGAVVPWADRLWVITYSPHRPAGSDDKLYEIDNQLKRTIRPESVGGTPANRMIHRESNQLNIGPYFIDRQRNVRVVSPSQLFGRLTATARHLTDPANKLYLLDMEGLIYEIDVHQLEPTLLFKRPVPGWHGKGGYTGQGRLVLSNNGEHAAGSVNRFKPFDNLIDSEPKGPEDAGVLAEWDGTKWQMIRRRQFTDVTGPGGILGPTSDKSPLWAIGWDRRSLLLELRDKGHWHTFRLPIADYSYVAKHGWHTEWPRIREVTDGKYLMNLHGGWFDFPADFALGNTGKLRPIGSYLKVTADFCGWNERIVFGCDDTALSGFSKAGVSDTLNRLNGQSNSNLWFTTWKELANAGQPSGFGGPWLEDAVKANVPSDPFLIGGYRYRCLHIAINPPRADTSGGMRCSDKYELSTLPNKLANLPRVTISRDDFHQPAPNYSFQVNQDVTIYLAVDDRGNPTPNDGWRKTAMRLAWGEYTDTVFVKKFSAGRVNIPGNSVEHSLGAYGLPHSCFVESDASNPSALKITELPKHFAAKVTRPRTVSHDRPKTKVHFTLEINRGDGQWTVYKQVTVDERGYAFHLLPADTQGTWIRLKADRDVDRVTAYFHLGPGGGQIEEKSVFASLADVDVERPQPYTSAVIRSEGDNKILLGLLAQSVDASGRVGPARTYQVDANLRFHPTNPESKSARFLHEKTLVQNQVIAMDDASVIVTEGHRRVRLPKSHEAYDSPWATGWPRALREVVTERSLLNAAGSFYVVPRGNSGGVRRIKPICTHAKRITDFCSWRGMLVVAGCRNSAKPDGHFFATNDGTTDGTTGLWFGDIDDLWKLGKPVGHGGPWLNTAVKKEERSDPYLMTGYDVKTLELSHDAQVEVNFRIEVDITGNEMWLPYTTIRVPHGELVSHVFPAGYSAHWVRFSVDRACRATAQLDYR